MDPGRRLAEESERSKAGEAELGQKKSPMEKDASRRIRTRATQVAIVVLVLAVLAAPFAITARHFEIIFEGEGSLDILHSLSALIAICLLFLEILTGSFRPLLARGFRPATLNVAHIGFGLAGLSFALAHFILLLPHFGEYFSDYNRALILVGAVALVLLPLTIVTALLPRRFPGSWRLLHLLNYFIFIIALIHALAIGSDRALLAFKLLMYGFLGVSTLGLAYRAFSTGWWRRWRRAGGRAPATGGGDVGG